MDRVLNENVLKSLKDIKELLVNNGFNCKSLDWENIYTDLQGNAVKFNTEETFFIYPERLKEAIECKFLDRILDNVKELTVKNVVLAFDNKESISKTPKEEISLLVQKCKEKNLACMPAFWKLKLKGVDDYFASTARNINYI